jgi:hypothetical protein
MRPTRHLSSLIATVLLGCVLASCGPADDQAPASPGASVPAAETIEGPEGLSPEDALAEFQALCVEMRESDEMYRGRGPLRRLQQQMAGPALVGDEAIVVRRDLSRELLKQGRSEEAVAMAREALEIAEQQNADPHLILSIMDALALAHMRAAEDTNCVLHHTSASCIVPISREGMHPRPEHARAAGDVLQQMIRRLQVTPRSVQAAFLLNIMRMVSGDWPQGVPAQLRLPQNAFRSPPGLSRWPDRAIMLDVAAFDLAGAAIMDDFDGDGLLDLVSSTSDHCKTLRAFRNDGRGGFEEVTAAWGLDSQMGGLNMVHADYDNDGRLDLLVLRGAWLHEFGSIRNSLLRNELGGPRNRFVDVTVSAGMGLVASPTQNAVWADYDSDGDLDLFIGNESQTERPHPSRLYRNNGDGTFTDVAITAGVTNDRFAKASAWGDYDDDGDPDLYVSNHGPNRLYRNDGDGTFTDVAQELSVTEPRVRSFADWFFDYDNDGDLDLFVADYVVEPALVAVSYFNIDVNRGHPRIYRNDGGRFTDASGQLGLTRPLLPMGANYGDLDNDGWLDFYLGTGDPSYESVMPNVMYRNVGGRRFEDVTYSGGFGHLQKGHGVAFGDLDNDGDQDLFHQLGGFYPGDAFANVLFENPGTDAAWVTLRLEGRRANRFGVGARIEVRIREADGKRRSVHVLAGSGGSFGGSSMQQEIGLGRAEAIEAIVVRWPGSGTEQTFSDVSPNRVYDLIEGEPDLKPASLPRFTLGRTP